MCSLYNSTLFAVIPFLGFLDEFCNVVLIKLESPIDLHFGNLKKKHDDGDGGGGQELN